MKKVKPFRYVYLALMLLFLYLPIIYLIVFSFNDFSTGRRVSYANLGRWNGFTLENYTNVFAGEAGSALLLTLEVALITSVVATVIGTFAAIGINSMKKRPKSIILNISQLPMVNPDLVTGITFMMLFAFVNGVLANMGADRLSDIVKLLITVCYLFGNAAAQAKLVHALRSGARSWLHAHAGHVPRDNSGHYARHNIRLHNGAYNVAGRLCGQLFRKRSKEHIVRIYVFRRARIKGR